MDKYDELQKKYGLNVRYLVHIVKSLGWLFAFHVVWCDYLFFSGQLDSKQTLHEILIFLLVDVCVAGFFAFIVGMVLLEHYIKRKKHKND